jgi:hypothetical protein
MALNIFFEQQGLYSGLGSIRKTKVDLTLEMHPFPRAQKHPPIILLILLQQQNLHLSASLVLEASQSGRKHSRVIQYENIPSLGVLNQISELLMENPLIQPP